MGIDRPHTINCYMVGAPPSLSSHQFHCSGPTLYPTMEGEFKDWGLLDQHVEAYTTPCVGQQGAEP